MLLHIEGMLKEQELRALRAIAETGTYLDGRETAGGELHGVKQVEQMRHNQRSAEHVQSVVRDGLARCDRFQPFAQPKRLLTPRISRYRKGMQYGDHYDSLIMGNEQSGTWRSDLSMTVFLNEPDRYEGGELCIESGFGALQYKLPAGDAVIYSTTVKHRVNPILDGERLVVIAWIESYIRDPEKRQIIYDLQYARDTLKRTSTDDAVMDHLQHAHASLFRRLADA